MSSQASPDLAVSKTVKSYIFSSKFFPNEIHFKNATRDAMHLIMTLCDTADNIVAIYTADTSFSTFQLFGIFLAVEGCKVLPYLLCLGPAYTAILSIVIEIAQCFVYSFISNYNLTAVAIFSSIGAVQCMAIIRTYLFKAQLLKEAKELDSPHPAFTMRHGADHLMKLTGSAVSGGGSIALILLNSLSNEKAPFQDKTFQVAMALYIFGFMSLFAGEGDMDSRSVVFSFHRALALIVVTGFGVCQFIVTILYVIDGTEGKFDTIYFIIILAACSVGLFFLLVFIMSIFCCNRRGSTANNETGEEKLALNL